MSAQPPRRRPRLVGVIVIGLIALIAVSVIASLSLDDGTEERIAVDGAQEVRRLVGGIPQLDERLGESDAPVTVEVFNDVQCTDCAAFQLDVVEPLIGDEVRGGDVKLLFRHYSVTDRPAGISAYGAVAAGFQAQQWQFIELLFRNQDQAPGGRITQEFLDEVAKGVLNLNVEQWQRDFEDEEIPETLEAQDLLAVQRRIPAEPAVVVDGPGGTRELIETPSLEQVRAAIAEVSEQAG